MAPPAAPSPGRGWHGIRGVCWVRSAGKPFMSSFKPNHSCLFPSRMLRGKTAQCSLDLRPCVGRASPLQLFISWYLLNFEVLLQVYLKIIRRRIRFTMIHIAVSLENMMEWRVRNEPRAPKKLMRQLTLTLPPHSDMIYFLFKYHTPTKVTFKTELLTISSSRN